ncbi:MAG TPA: hypothetical protein VK927_05540, partial [Adhaeribacter sp.]|nr:hypothetical protein [Adhaeribacter sp.]
AAFTTSCSETEEKRIENETESTIDAADREIDEAITPERGDTATVINRETDGLIERTETDVE